MKEDKLRNKQVQFFYSGATLDIKSRIVYLKKLKECIKNYEHQITEALCLDLGKGSFEAFSSEIGLVLHELSMHIRNLRKWAKPQRAKTPVHAFPSRSFIYKQPLGRVLIISPFNYPFMLAVGPLIGAVSAGNVAVVKPSELTPHTSAVIKDIIEKVFKSEYVEVVQGGVDVSRQLLDERWDKIFFTGSSRVGKIVMEAAARNLTPVVLELGGKNPVVVDNDANLEVAARRIMWGKLLNAGQSCVAPDYLYIHKDVSKAFLQFMKESITRFLGEPKTNKDFTGIVNGATVQRLAELMKDVHIFHGGDFDAVRKYVSPTLLTDVSNDSSIMKEEIFGPILPVLEFEDFYEVIETVNKREKPLAAYYFSENKEKQKYFLQHTFSGDAMINDVVLHFTNNSLPFGGVGNSGIGKYHGKGSFDIFSHERSVMKTSTLIDLPLRYPPYKEKMFRLLHFLFR